MFVLPLCFGSAAMIAAIARRESRRPWRGVIRLRSQKRAFWGGCCMGGASDDENTGLIAYLPTQRAL